MHLLDEKIYSFYIIAQTGTVHGAARTLKVTQTALTHRIRLLEEQLGQALFVRSNKGMDLTADGQALLRYCKGVLELQAGYFRETGRKGQEADAHLTLAGPTSLMETRLPRQLLPVYKAWPRLNLHLVLDDRDAPVDLLTRGLADLVVTEAQSVPPSLDCIALASERYVLVCTAKWKRRSLEELLHGERIIDFHDEDSTTLAFLRQTGVRFKPKRSRLAVGNNRALLALLLEGVGFGVLLEEVAQPFLGEGGLMALHGGKSLERKIVLAWHRQTQVTAYFKDIVSALSGRK